MSSVIEYHIKSYVSGEALAAYVRVKKSGNNVVTAGAGEAAIGVTLANCASGDPVSVRLFNGFGSVFMKASAAITQNALVYPTAAGCIDDSPTFGTPLGYAEQAATASGDIIEVLLLGRVPTATAASAGQAIATDLPSVLLLANELRLAAIAQGLIKGSA